MPKFKFTKELKKLFIKKYVENDFHLGLTCDEVGISRPTFYKAKRFDDDFADDVKDAENGLDDILFSYIMEGLKDQDTRYNYLKLMSAQKIDKIMERGATVEKVDNKIIVTLE